MKLWQYFIVSIFFLVALVAKAELKNISCVYETSEIKTHNKENHHDHFDHVKLQKPAKWYFWRTGKAVEVSNADQSFGEKWSITDKKHVFYQALYHDKKFLLDFQPADLTILGKNTNWDVRSTLFSQKILKRLEQKSTSEFNKYDKVRYEGTVAGVEYKIDWLPELKLPARVEMNTAGKVIVTELKEVYPLAETPYKQKSTVKYDDMDYADIGDNESHPVVAQLQKSSGVGYFHQH